MFFTFTGHFMKLTDQQIKDRISGISTKELAIKLLVKLDDEINQARSRAKVDWVRRKITMIEKQLAATRF
jgi:hypothetical protein